MDSTGWEFASEVDRNELRERKVVSLNLFLLPFIIVVSALNFMPSWPGHCAIIMQIVEQMSMSLITIQSLKSSNRLTISPTSPTGYPGHHNSLQSMHFRCHLLRFILIFVFFFAEVFT